MKIRLRGQPEPIVDKVVAFLEANNLTISIECDRKKTFSFAKFKAVIDQTHPDTLSEIRGYGESASKAFSNLVENLVTHESTMVVDRGSSFGRKQLVIPDDIRRVYDKVVDHTEITSLEDPLQNAIVP